ncbi:hypothetical protein [Streptomyces sp. NPDC057199]|uniref:hypothetical protein n=1 Tax=Streptomyces sp. NPDC057199 TaxID=3346047 RepID=UPI00362A4BDE
MELYFMTHAVGVVQRELVTTTPPSRRHGSLTEWSSVGLASLALIVSGLSWKESHSANSEVKRVNRETQRSEQREQASKTSYVRNRYPEGAEELTVINRSHALIADVTITFTDGSYIEVGAVGSCTQWSLSPVSLRKENGETVPLLAESRLDFTDSQEPPERWTIEGTGLRSRDTNPKKQKNITDLVSSQIRFSGVQQCG